MSMSRIASLVSRHRSHAFLVPCAAAALSLAACSTPPAAEHASRGDLDKMGSALEKAPAESNQELRAIAEALLSHAIDEAKTVEDRTFVRSLRSCAVDLSAPLRKKAKVGDAVSGEAAMLLFESGQAPSPAPSSYADSPDGAWRALAARASKLDDDQRRAFLEDPDERVRRAALDASLEAEDVDDQSLLLSISRKDPDPLCRSKAIASLAALGGEEVYQRLKDRYAEAPEALRLAIVDAYGSSKLRPVGGLRQLERLTDSGEGFASLHAAYHLMRSGPLQAKGSARLRVFATSGSEQERRLALRWLSSDDAASRQLLLELSEDEDASVRVIALSRLLGREEARDQASAALRSLAQSDDSVAFEARAALAAAGDSSVLPLLKKQAKSDDPELRRAAGYSLLQLSAAGGVSQLLADEVSWVRQPLACRALASTR